MKKVFSHRDLRGKIFQRLNGEKEIGKNAIKKGSGDRGETLGKFLYLLNLVKTLKRKKRSYPYFCKISYLSFI
jgi:hypothetical protein